MTIISGEVALADQFKGALRRLASSVAVVSSADGSRLIGMTATAVTSVSLAPPTLLVCVNRSANLHAAVARSGCFRVSYLGQAQSHVAAMFGGGVPQDERFATSEWRQDPDGPSLVGSLTEFACTLDQAVDCGTHTVFIGRVKNVVDGQDASVPLVYWDGRYCEPNVATSMVSAARR
ncbi:flavin reductase family protein [Cupriavidus sp. AcVe19-1a]|uniref:flavin reductase family protein n=1 Tax=Cupriavidus sp. AcVe19-1a TaxID=2821359 RepID=UPI001AE9878B|nr:flavin reductase family protein [Cupriavidus sp. AcVe19-1a]MBP0630545.1 flavin reductase [Cupriavidus sp. AcVe19-1a]